MSTANQMNILVIFTRAPTPSNGKNIENNGKNPLFWIIAVFWGGFALFWGVLNIHKQKKRIWDDL